MSQVIGRGPGQCQAIRPSWGLGHISLDLERGRENNLRCSPLAHQGLRVQVDERNLEHFRVLLLQEREQILNGVASTSREDLRISPDDLADETDMANNVVGQTVSFTIIHRAFANVRLIDEALLRIDQGNYGHCEECLGPVGKKRLTHRPWATLCITCAEEQERPNRALSL